MSISSAIIFDLDETLIDRAATIERAAFEQFRCFQSELLTISGEEFVTKFIEFDDKGRSHKRETFEKLADYFKLPGSMWQKLLNDRDARVPGCSVLCDGAIECLNEVVKYKLPLGMITNKRYPIQVDKMKFVGIDKYFKEILVSGVEGIEKPHPEIFLRALSRLDASPEKSIFIGDDPQKDILGAKGVGIKTIFVKSKNFELSEEADSTVASLREVPKAIDRLLSEIHSQIK